MLQRPLLFGRLKLADLILAMLNHGSSRLVLRLGQHQILRLHLGLRLRLSLGGGDLRRLRLLPQLRLRAAQPKGKMRVQLPPAKNATVRFCITALSKRKCFPFEKGTGSVLPDGITVADCERLL